MFLGGAGFSFTPNATVGALSISRLKRCRRNGPLAGGEVCTMVCGRMVRGWLGGYRFYLAVIGGSVCLARPSGIWVGISTANPELARRSSVIGSSPSPHHSPHPPAREGEEGATGDNTVLFFVHNRGFNISLCAIAAVHAICQVPGGPAGESFGIRANVFRRTKDT